MTAETLDLRRRRAQFRAAHRGTKEMDWLVGRYADATLSAMGEAEMTIFEQFLNLPDPDLQDWILNPAALAHSEFGPLVADLRAFHGL